MLGFVPQPNEKADTYKMIFSEGETQQIKKMSFRSDTN
jgi:hypothetical protein